MKLITPVAYLMVFTVACGILLIVSWTIVAVSSAKHYLDQDTPETNGFHHVKPTDLFKTPSVVLYSSQNHIFPAWMTDKSTLVVTSEEALPSAFELLRRNMHLPIQRIVLMKQDANNTCQVYPIPRDGLIGLGNRMSISVSDIALILFFLVFIIGSFTYIFTSMTTTKVFWEDDFGLNNEELSDVAVCLEAVEELRQHDENELLVKAEKKRKEIEEA